MDIRFERLSKQNLGDAILLLQQYGDYMFEQLQLLAGKQTFYEELNEDLLKKYTLPFNRFLIAYYNGDPVGCVGLKKWNETDCEMKRLYVDPAYRSIGLGKLLTEKIVEEAADLGYTRMLLDTNQEMVEAVQLYRKCGFIEIPPYCYNENKHVIYMQKLVGVASQR